MSEEIFDNQKFVMNMFRIINKINLVQNFSTRTELLLLGRSSDFLSRPGATDLKLIHPLYLQGIEFE